MDYGEKNDYIPFPKRIGGAALIGQCGNPAITCACDRPVVSADDPSLTL